MWASSAFSWCCHAPQHALADAKQPRRCNKPVAVLCQLAASLLLSTALTFTALISGVLVLLLPIECPFSGRTLLWNEQAGELTLKRVLLCLLNATTV